MGEFNQRSCWNITQIWKKKIESKSKVDGSQFTLLELKLLYQKFLLTFIINWPSETLGLTNWQLPVKSGKKYYPSG